MSDARGLLGASAQARKPALIAGAALLVAATPFLGEFWLFAFTLAIIYVLASLSLVVLTGWSGQLNLHVAALGLGWGSYAAFALVSLDVPAFVALLTAGALTIPFAAIVAAAAVRFRGLELAVATLAIGLIFERLFFRNLGKWLSSSSGVATPFETSFVPMPRPSLGGLDLSGDLAFFAFSLLVASALFALVRNLGAGATGRTFRAVRERELMAEAVGVPVLRYRITAFVVSIFIAATAGGLFASYKLGIAPDSYNLDTSFQILAATVIGGIRSPGGALIGGALGALLPELVRFGPLQIFSGERLFVLFGAGMVLALWRLPEGLVGLAGRLRSRGAAPLQDDAALATMPVHANGALSAVEVSRRIYRSRLDRQARPTLLRVDGVRVRFGGVVALDGVSLSVPEGEICALIGPNGAGKSTLFNVINGFLPPDEGALYFRGEDVTEYPAYRRASLGIGRTFQSIEVFREMTVLDNLMLAGHRLRTAGLLEEALSLPAARRSETIVRDRAREVLSILGMDLVAGRMPGELPLGMLRVLEMGMSLMAQPSMLLLDEPSSGLDASETAAMATLVSRVRSAYGLGVLLVEHDMAMVGRLAEHVFVLDFGRIIAEGTPEQVRENPIVLEKYLGQAFEPPAPAAAPTASRKRRKPAASKGGGSRARG